MQFPFVLGKSKWFYIVTVIYFDLSLLPPATKLGQGNIFTGICDSVHRGVLPQCMLGFQPPPPPRTRQAPPWDQAGTRPLGLDQAGTRPLGLDQAGTPLGPGRHPPPGPGSPPPRPEHTGRYSQRAGGMHPTEMQSCLYYGPSHILDFVHVVPHTWGLHVLS